MINPKRILKLKNNNYSSGPIVYWMTREHRVHDNWSLVYAQQLTKQHNTHLVVVFCLRQKFSHATDRLVSFLLGGLKYVQEDLQSLNIPFYFLIGDPTSEIPRFVSKHKAGFLISDFHPLKPFTNWYQQISSKISIPFDLVDSRNIVPIWEASPKPEFGAYTLRPKILKLLDEFLTPFPKLSSQTTNSLIQTTDFAKIKSQIAVDASVPTVDWIVPGPKAAQQLLKKFITTKLPTYATSRNDPNKDSTSLLSTHLHFGHISTQTIATAANASLANRKSVQAFLEELVIRRELADNYCYYTKDYDNPNGFPDWAKKTHSEHASDKRDYVYTLQEFETASIHDPLWNACMNQAKHTGIMHGYMRMYWAKKILEWSENVETAQKIAIHLMDRYFLDGRDSNGFTGIAWSMGGVHDRAWFDRKIFGKIRYMNSNGAKSKFDVEKYIKMYN